MPRERSFAILLGILVLGGLAAGFLERPERREIEPRLAAGLVASPQRVSQRRWRSTELEPVADWSLDSIRPESVTVLRLGSGGNIYVLEAMADRLREYSPKGRLLATFHTFALSAGADHPSDFAVRRDGTLLVAFSNLDRLGLLPGNGGAPRSLPLGTPAHRVSILGGGDIVTLCAGRRAWAFERYDAAGHRLATFGTLLAGRQLPLALEGGLAPAGDGDLVWAATFAGLLGEFRPDGALRYLVETVDAVPLPRIVEQSGGSRRYREPGSRPASLDLSVDRGHVYLLSPSGPSAASRAVDVYDANDGRYLDSLALPGAPRSLAVAGDRLYVLDGPRVRVWRVGRPRNRDVS